MKVFEKIDRIFEVLFDDIIVPNVRKAFYVFSGIMVVVNCMIAILAASDILSVTLFVKFLLVSLILELIMLGIMIVFNA